MLHQYTASAATKAHAVLVISLMMCLDDGDTYIYEITANKMESVARSPARSFYLSPSRRVSLQSRWYVGRLRFVVNVAHRCRP